jgi:hypothetical protein
VTLHAFAESLLLGFLAAAGESGVVAAYVRVLERAGLVSEGLQVIGNPPTATAQAARTGQNGSAAYP